VRRLLLFVSAVMIADTMLYAALVPLLPHFAHRYGLSKGGVGMLAAAYAIGVLVAAVPAGIGAGHLGVRRAVLGGLALMSAASVGFAFADSFATLFAARFVQGLGSSLTGTGALAWLAVATPRERRGAAMGTAMGAALFGALLGPVVGAIGSLIGIRATFSTVAVSGVLIAFWALRLEPPAPEPQSLRSAVRVLRSRELLAGLWLIMLPAILFGVVWVLVSLALSSRGFGAVAIGAVFLSTAAIEGTVSPLLGRAVDRHGFAIPVRLALFGSVVASLLLAATEWPFLLVPLVLLAGITYGALYAPALTFLSHAAENVGLAQTIAFGLMNAAWAVGNAVGSAGGGAIAGVTADSVPYLVGAAVCVGTYFAVRRLLAAAEIEGITGEAVRCRLRHPCEGGEDGEDWQTEAGVGVGVGGA
jgi:predicted MFS family arabinose efflux permease